MDSIPFSSGVAAMDASRPLHEVNAVANANPNLEVIWQHCVLQMQNGSKEPVINVEEPGLFTHVNIEFLATRFAKRTGHQASFLYTHETNTIKIFSDAYNADQPGFQRNPNFKIARERQNKAPRPPNAFILYRTANATAVKNSNPGMHNNQISQIIGKMWASEDPVVKEIYKQQAKSRAAQHAAMYPGYQYQPRRDRATRHSAGPRTMHPQPPLPRQPLTISSEEVVPNFNYTSAQSEGVMEYCYNPDQAGVFDMMVAKHNDNYMFGANRVEYAPLNDTFYSVMETPETAADRAEDQLYCDLNNFLTAETMAELNPVNAHNMMTEQFPNTLGQVQTGSTTVPANNAATTANNVLPPSGYVPAMFNGNACIDPDNTGL
ncbi:MAG: hypothetical protein M1828_000851 [Chrysothrix sp. TS-e1954]|nr:MAG: hypothetical protein M1828_000851 [Chrysothrix sp. TS-e1954]